MQISTPPPLMQNPSIYKHWYTNYGIFYKNPGIVTCYKNFPKTHWGGGHTYPHTALKANSPNINNSIVPPLYKPTSATKNPLCEITKFPQS